MATTAHVIQRTPERKIPTRVKSRRVMLSLDPLRLALAALTIMTVSRVHQQFDAVSQLRPAMLLVAATVYLAIVFPKLLTQRSILATWPAKVILALAIVACLSVPFSLSIGRSGVYVIGSYSKVVVYSFLLIAAIRGVRDLATFVWAYVAGCAILAWMSLFVFGVTETTDGALYRLDDLHSFDANDVGCVMLIGAALTLLLFDASKGRSRWIAGVVLIAIGATILKTGSRGAFVGVVVFGAYTMLALRHVSIWRRIAVMAVLAVAFVVTAPPGYWEQMKTITKPTEDYNWDSVNGRREVAIRGLGYMMDRPFLGVGISNFQLAEGTISEKARTRVAGTGIRFTAPHNTYLQVGAELGIPGLLLWLTLVFGGIFSMHRLRSRLPRQWLRGDSEERFLYLAAAYLPLALVGFAVTSFFVSFAYLDPIYIVTALMAGLYVSAQAKLAGRPVPRATTASRQPVPRRATFLKPSLHRW